MYLELSERLGEIFYANKEGKNYLDGCTRNSIYKSTGLFGTGIVRNLF